VEPKQILSILFPRRPKTIQKYANHRQHRTYIPIRTPMFLFNGTPGLTPRTIPRLCLVSTPVRTGEPIFPIAPLDELTDMPTPTGGGDLPREPGPLCVLGCV
jgi:hypothetical protein